MKTREQLIARVLKNLQVLAAGQAPSDEDRAEVDDLIEPVCAKLLDDGVAKLTGDEIEDAAYLPLAAVIAEAALVPFGIAGQKAADLVALADRARMDLRLAYRVYDARPPMRIEPFWGRRCGLPPIVQGGAGLFPPNRPDLTPEPVAVLLPTLPDLTPETVAALLPTLPTVLPGVPGQPWNNGGLLSWS